MKLIISLLLILLVATNGYWVYITLDSGITKTYMDASLDAATKQRDQLVRIIEQGVVGMPVAEALKLLNPDVFGSAPFKKEGCLYAGQVCLQLNENQTVVGVTVRIESAL